MITTEVSYRQAQRTVLTGDAAQLERLGQHLVVGYTDFDHVKTLVETLPFRAATFKLPGLGHFLPAAFFAFNPDNDTVSTDFSAYLD